MTRAKQEQAARILGITAVTQVAASDLTSRRVSRKAMWAAIDTAKLQVASALRAFTDGDDDAAFVFTRAALATLGNLGSS